MRSAMGKTSLSPVGYSAKGATETRKSCESRVRFLLQVAEAERMVQTHCQRMASRC